MSLLPDELDDEWRIAARKRACKLFPNQGLQPMATLMASSHPYAIDYLEQAPVIVLAVTRGRYHERRSERAYIAGAIAEKSRRGDRLRDVLRDYGLPLQLRKLAGSALTPKRWPIIIRLSALKPSTLAQIIPSTNGSQIAWMRALGKWLGRMKYRSASNPGLNFEWAAGALSGLPYGQHEVAADLADFVAANADTFNPRWTLAQAERAKEEWHVRLARRSDAAKQMEAAGVGFEAQVDYSPLPDSTEIDGYSLVALRSGQDLFTEGAAMRHCVASYIQSVVTGKSRIYSIRLEDRRVATLEVQPTSTKKKPRTVIGANGKTFDAYEIVPGGFKIAQLKGPCNSAVPKKVREAADAFVREHANAE